MDIVFGAGEVGKRFIAKCHEKGIQNICVVDSNRGLWGRKCEGETVRDFNSIALSSNDLVVIAVASKEEQGQIKRMITQRCEDINSVLYYDAVIIAGQDRLSLGKIKGNKPIQKGIYTMGMMVDCFDINSMSELEKYFFFGQHRTIHKWVHYFEYYDRFFSKYKGKAPKILEIGVYQGGSLQMWKQYFGDKSEIIGVDINESCRVYEEENIRIIIGDAGNDIFLQSLKETLGKVDIIIDDGGHYMAQQINAFKELFGLLDDEGVYVKMFIQAIGQSMEEGMRNKKLLWNI